MGKPFGQNQSALPSTASKSTPPAIRTIGDYELIEEIARGGMGVVYRARQVSLDRTVAVKVALFGAHAGKDAVERFRIEATAAAALQHPNIVAIHEVGVQGGEHFLVMDFVDGVNLAKLVKEQPLPAKRAAEYLKSIADTIHFAHERGVLHRDLKPSNILIDSNGQPRVTDFGVAKRLSHESSSNPESAHLTHTGHVLGTPGYMPPEQACGVREKVGRRSDVYSLGALLYHLLTGRPPFGGGSVADTLRQVEFQEPVSPRLLNASVPLDLETICLKCLEKEPSQRYANAQELSAELQRFLLGETILARPVSQTERLWRWSRRKPALAITGALAVLAALWAGYNAWSIHSTKVEAREREEQSWASLFNRSSPRDYLYYTSEDLAAFFGERPKARPRTLRVFIGMYLEKDQQHMVRQFAPLLRYLEHSLSTDFEPVRTDLIVYRGREALEQVLLAEDVKDLVHFGRIGESGMRQLLMHTNTGLVPVVQQKSGGKVSVLFARKDTGITNLLNLKGRRLALGSVGSTASGYKLPKLLLEQSLTKSDIQAVYHDSSEENVDLVLRRKFDAGVTRKDLFDTYTDSSLTNLIEFETTRMPWLATKRVTPDLARRFQHAMTTLTDRKILEMLPENPTSGFMAVDAKYFNELFEDMDRVKRSFFHKSAPTAPINPP